MSDQLPPLPHPWLLSICSVGLLREDVYVADQMHAYARAAMALAYERAAKECERYAGAFDGEYNRRVLAAAAAIRALALEAK